MGTWNYLFDNDLLQRIDLERLNTRAALAESRIRRAQQAHGDRLEELEREFGQLTLVCRALIGMLKEQGAFDAAVFNAALDKIDAEDGVIDGQVTPEAQRPTKPESLPSVIAPTPRKRR